MGCVVPRGPQQHTSAGPGGALYRRRVKKDPWTHSPKGRGLDLVDDGTLSRERGRLDVMGFLEQVRTSCGPQSLSKCRMPGLGVCGPSGASNTRLSWPLGSMDCRNKSALAAKLRFLSKSMRMPGLGVCGSSGASTTHLSWSRRSIVPSKGQKGPLDAFPQGAWA